MKNILKRAVAFICACLVLIPSLIFTGCSGKDKVVMEYEGYSITEGMYSYWMKSWKEYYLKYYSDVSDTEQYWSTVNDDGITNDSYLTGVVKTRIKYYLVSMKLFDEYELELDNDAKNGIEDDINAQIEHYGSKSDCNKALKDAYGIDLKILRKIFTVEEKHTAVYKYLYGDTSGINSATPEELEAYYRNYYVRVKYVMFYKAVKYKLDDEGNRITDTTTGYYKFEDMTEEEIVQTKQNADNVLSAVKNGENIDTYMVKYNGSYGFELAKYPNGYYISPDDYSSHTAEVTTAAMEMSVGEVRFVENDACYFVLQKFELIDKAYSSDIDGGQFSSLLTYCNNEKYSKQYEEMFTGISVDTAIAEKYTMSLIK